MLNLERMDYIWKEIQKKKTVYVKQLAAQYFVSPSTIRRDLAELESHGLVRRTYGGGILIEKQNAEIPYMVRKSENREAKEIIGRMAAALIEDGMFLGLDTTTTTASVVKHLREKNNLKIITTSAQTALDCLDKLTARIYCTGGWMSDISRGFIGESARSRLEEFYADYVFFSGRAISIDKGLMDVNEEDVYLKQAMLNNGRHVVLLADSTKFDQHSYRKVCGWEQVEYLITEKKPQERWLKAMQQAGVSVRYPK